MFWVKGAVQDAFLRLNRRIRISS